VLHAYCPRISLGRQASEEMFIQQTTRRSTFGKGEVAGIQINMIEALIGMLREGRPVDTGLGIFTPSIDLNGQISVKVRVKAEVLRALNETGAFRGVVANAEYIGQPFSALIEQWNANHPDDPVE
jgi:hypothetical protein